MNYPHDWSDEYSKQGLCGVLALAMTANISIGKSNRVLAKNLMPHQKRHVKTTYPEQLIKSLQYLGKEVIVQQDLPRKTLRRTVEQDLQRGVTYMVLTSHHAVTVRDGIVADQAEILPILQHGAKRQFVTHIIAVFDQ